MAATGHVLLDEYERFIEKHVSKANERAETIGERLAELENEQAALGRLFRRLRGDA